MTFKWYTINVLLCWRHYMCVDVTACVLLFVSESVCLSYPSTCWRARGDVTRGRVVDLKWPWQPDVVFSRGVSQVVAFKFVTSEVEAREVSLHLVSREISDFFASNWYLLKVFLCKKNDKNICVEFNVYVNVEIHDYIILTYVVRMYF